MVPCSFQCLSWWCITPSKKNDGVSRLNSGGGLAEKEEVVWSWPLQTLWRVRDSWSYSFPMCGQGPDAVCKPHTPSLDSRCFGADSTIFKNKYTTLDALEMKFVRRGNNIQAKIDLPSISSLQDRPRFKTIEDIDPRSIWLPLITPPSHMHDD